MEDEQRLRINTVSKSILLMCVIALVYALFAKLFLSFATANGNVSFIYPSSGIALAALLLYGRKIWPAIFFGSLIESLWVHDPAWVAILIAIGNTLSSVLALHLLKQRNFDTTLSKLQDVYILTIFGGALSSVIAAVIGVGVLTVADVVEGDKFVTALFTWWGGDTLGIILFTPIVLLWREFPSSWFKPQRFIEIITFYTLVWLFGQVIFFDQFSELLAGYSREFWITPFIFYSAFRLGLRGTLLLLAMILTQASLGAANHIGVFAHDLHSTGMGNVWLYLSVYTLIGLMLTVLNKQRNKNERELKASEQRFQKLAFHDALTGLPNRPLFFDRLSKSLAQAKRSQGHLALIYLDLDGFKPINDERGHEIGDCVLKVVAQRLIGCVRDVDTVARIGGDEFAVVLDGVETPSEAAMVAQKILNALSAPMHLYGTNNDTHHASIGASVGIALYPENGMVIDTLVAAADAAMYESKHNGKNRFSFSAAHSTTDTPVWMAPDSYHLGIAELDIHHQELADIIERINAMVYSKQDWGTIKQAINELESALDKHFTKEHELMTETRFPNKPILQEHHLKLAKELGFIKIQFAENTGILAIRQIRKWMQSHIDGDRPLAEHLAKNRS